MNPATEDTVTQETVAVAKPNDDLTMQSALGSLWEDLCGLVHDHIQLAALETRRAGEGLVLMIGAGLMVAVLLNGAWLGIMAGLVLGLTEHGIDTSSAILLAAAGNLLGALLGCGFIRHKSRTLLFSATLQSIAVGAKRKSAGNKS
jgi:hypothetical protein